MSDQDLLDKEDAAVLDDTAKDFSPQEQAEFGKLAENDQVGKGYTGNQAASQKGGFWSKRKKIGAGIAAAGATAGITLTILLGPHILINSLREIILNRVSQVQVDQTKRYRRSKIRKVSDLFSRDGRIGSKVIDDMESRGYKFSYEPKSNRVIGLSLPDGKSSVIGDAIGDHIDDYMEIRHPLRTARWKTKRTEALYKRYGVSRSPIVAPTDEKIDSPEKEVNKRLAEDALEEPVDVEGEAETAPENETDAQREAREAREAATKEANETTGVIGDVRQDVLQGDDLGESATKAGLESGEDVIEQLGTGSGEQVLKAATTIAATQSLGGKVLSGVKGLLNPTDILDKVCTLKNRLRMSVTIARNLKAITLLKYATSFVRVGDDVRKGTVDPSLLNAVMKRTTANDRNGNAIGASPGFAYALRGKFSKSNNDSFKGSYGVDGKLTGTWKGVQDGTNAIPGTGKNQCGVIQNPFLQAASAIVITGGKALLCTVTVGAGCAASQSLEEGAKLTAMQAIKVSIQTSIKQVVSRQALKETAQSLAVRAALELSFEGMMVLTQMYIEKSLALPVTGQEKGAELGSMLVAGGGAANKQRSLQAGMVPATTTQYAQAESRFLAQKKEDLKSQSLWTRFADLNNSDSMAFQVSMSAPMGFTQAVDQTASMMNRTIGSVLNGGSLVSWFGGLFAGKAHADDEISFDEYTLEAGPSKGESLAIDFAGNPQVILRDDIAAIDPDENIPSLVASGDIDATTLEPRSDRFKNHIENCVNSMDTFSTLEFKESKNDATETDCLAKQSLTVRFKAHLAYLDMIDGLEGEFLPEQIASGATTVTSSTVSAPVVGDTADVPCTTGTNDMGEVDGYSNGNKYRIRICEIPEFTSSGSEDANHLVRVNSTASANWLQLFRQAKSAGVSLVANSSFRSMPEQQRLYDCYINKNCNNGNLAAKPGFSNHQIGFAIDVDVAPGKDPSLTTCQANPDSYSVYKWLASNASAYGIAAGVASECWHWSTSGT